MQDGSGFSNCTGGFNFKGSNGSVYILTAGHCTSGNNKYVYKGLTQSNPLTQTQGYSLCNYCMDSVLFPANTIPYVWDSATNARGVTGRVLIELIGDKICTSGAFTNAEVCGVSITNKDQDEKGDDGIWRTDQTVATKSGTNVCRKGDSGGPTYSIASNGAAMARGEMLLCSGSPGSTVYYQPVADLIGHYGMAMQFASSP